MRTVTIKSGQLGRFDDGSPFLVESGALDLKFVLPQSAGDYFLSSQNVYADGSKSQTRQIPKSGEISLSDLLPGTLSLCVKHYLRGICLATYNVEPLLLKEVDAGIATTPEFALLERRVTALEKTNERMEKRLEEMEKSAEEYLKEMEKERKDTEDAIRTLYVKFLAFAWSEYSTDFRLNTKNLSPADFLRAMGADPGQFSETEMNEIKNKKEEL